MGAGYINPGDFNPAAVPDYTAAALEGTQAGQQMAQAAALRGIDMNDPASVNKGMGAVVRAGGIETASALANLGFLRFQQQAAIQGYQQAGDLFSGGGGQGAPAATAAPSGPTPDEQQAMSAQQMAHAQQVAQFGKTSADQLLSIQDPVLRRLRLTPSQRKPSRWASPTHSCKARWVTFPMSIFPASRPTTAHGSSIQRWGEPEPAPCRTCIRQPKPSPKPPIHSRTQMSSSS